MPRPQDLHQARPRREAPTGEETETRREAKPVGPRCYRPGKTFAAQPGRLEKGVARSRLLSAEREVLKEITEQGVRREGFEDRARFPDHWRGPHGRSDVEQVVRAIRFELIEGGAA